MIYFLQINDILEKFDINKFLKEIEKEDYYSNHKKILEMKLKILNQNYQFDLISEEQYLKAKRKIERKLNKFI